MTEAIKRARERAATLGGEPNPHHHQRARQRQIACNGHNPDGKVLQFRHRAR